MGFPGGGVKRHESPSEAITRELFEELGENVSFTDADLQFSVVEGERVTFTFLQVWRDAAKFSSLLRAFEAEHTRKGYVNEVFSVRGLPLYFEAPAEYSKPMP
jgi:8-oxo-dGTP pyrophosphatase MutT (NUDIX family)